MDSSLPEDRYMFRRITFLGIAVDLMTATDLTNVVARTIELGDKLVIPNHNMHSLCLITKCPEMEALYRRAPYVHVDGMSIIFLGRLYGNRISRIHRTGYSEWLPSIWPLAVERQWRVFVVGSSPKVLQQGLAILRSQYPGLRIVGHHGYFHPSKGESESEAVLGMIEAFSPNVLFVGMGMPRQEKWIQENLDRLNVNVILPCGAAFDYIAGVQAVPPRWLSRSGFEWAFRLIGQPRRLAHRYLWEPLPILLKVIRDIVCGAIWPREGGPTGSGDPGG